MPLSNMQTRSSLFSSNPGQTGPTPRPSPSSTALVECGQTYSLHIHDLNFSAEEMVLNPEAFPHVAVNDVLEISPNAALEGAGDGAAEDGGAQQGEEERRKKSLFLQVHTPRVLLIYMQGYTMGITRVLGERRTL